MYYIRQFYIAPYDAKLKDILENDYHIPCDIHTHAVTGEELAFIFWVSDLHPQIEELNRILPAETTAEESAAKEAHYAKTKEWIKGCVLVSHFAQYSEEERRSAKWLYARNVTAKVIPVNCETVDGHQCFVKLSKMGHPLGRHEIQNEPYVIRSPIKWGRSAFVSAEYHDERLFCSDRVRQILSANHITGIDFQPVLKKSTMQPMDDIHQLVFTHTIPDGVVVSISGMEDYVCDQCGMHMLRWSYEHNFYGLRDGVLDEDIDFWITQPMFLGAAPTDAVRAQQHLIISQKAYRFLIENKLDRGFDFTPLDTVDM